MVGYQLNLATDSKTIHKSRPRALYYWFETS